MGLKQGKDEVKDQTIRRMALFHFKKFERQLEATQIQGNGKECQESLFSPRMHEKEAHLDGARPFAK
jgi:hypothetical protein